MIVSDWVNGSTIKRGKDGFSAERIFFVDDVGGNAEQKLYNAMIQSGIPQYGDPHPFLPEVQVTNITAVPHKNGQQIRINVSYSLPSVQDVAETESEDENSPGTVSLNSSTSREVAFRDINGELLRTQYVDQIAGNISIQTKYAEADVQRPQLQVTFSRTESEIPKDRIDTYLGKVNSTAWSGYAPKTWLCSSITARENQNKFDVTYRFLYNKETWRLEVIHGLTQEQADALPIDVETGNGYAVYDVYESADFNALGVSF